MQRLQESPSAVKSMPTRKRRVPSNQPHCRCCGYFPRGSIYQSLNSQIISHIESAHRESALDVFSELDILLGQTAGDDSHCSYHGTDKRDAE